MTWFRFYTDTIQDRKIRRLSLAHRWLWVTVLSLAKESPVQGHLLLSRNVSVTFQDISDAAHLPIEEVESGIKLLQDLDMLHLDTDDETYIVTHWNKRQFVSDDATSRVQKYREKQKNNVAEPLHETALKRFDNVTCNNIETSHITETEKDKDKKNMGAYTPEFEKFWSVYPRKKEKQGAFKVWKARLKDGVESDKLIEAAKAYASECQQKGTEEQYRKHPKTFLGPSKPYEDYLKVEQAPIEKAKPRVTDPRDEKYMESLRAVYANTRTADDW